MSDQKDKIPGRKGKFLYLDKFIAHLQEDKSWKDNAVKMFSKFNRTTKLNTWAQIVNFLIALTALGIALVK